MFHFKSEMFDAEQATRDTVAQLPHVTLLVPAGDWIMYDLNPDGTRGRAIMHLTNAMFRELMTPTDSEGDSLLAAAIPVYVPAPNEATAPSTMPAGATEVPGGGPV